MGNDCGLVPELHVLSRLCASVVQDFMQANDLKLLGIGERDLELAVQACAEFGKGRHPAALNLGYCFAYACTKDNRAKLLFKGEDFTKTNIAHAD